MRRHISLALGTAVLAVFGSSLQAASISWDSTTADWPPTASQDWTVGGNWVGGAVPLATDTVVIQNGGAVLVSSPITINSGQMGNNAAGASLYIDNGGSLTVTNTSATAWRFFNAGPTRGYIASDGAFTVAGTLVVGTTVDGAGAVTVESAGTVTANSLLVSRGSVYTMTGGTLTVAQSYDSLVVGNGDAAAPTTATFKQTDGDVISTAGQLQLRAGGTYEISGGSINAGAGFSFRYASATNGGTIRVIGSGAREINFGGLRYFATEDQNQAKYSFILDNGANHITKINLTTSGNAGGSLRRGTLEVGLRGGVLLSGTDYFDVIEAPTITNASNFTTGPGPLWTHDIVDDVRDSVRVTLNPSALVGTLDAALGSVSFAPVAYGHVDLVNVVGNSLPIYLDLDGGTLSNLTAALDEASIGWTTSDLPDGYELGLLGLDPSVSGGSKFAWDLSSIDPSMRVQGIGMTVVPEPGTAMLLGAVFCGGLLLRGRRH